MKNKAFTLIELLVVVLIIGIFAAIAVPQYQKAVAKSQFATLKFLVKDIVQAQEAYYLANGKYANKFSDLDITLPVGKENYDTVIVYDWGSCGMTVHHIQCRSSKISMILDQYFAASHSPNHKVCIVGATMDLTDYRNEICKEETGATTSSVDKTYNVIYWTYQK